MKYYAVRRGRIPGIYSNYLDAWKQTQGFSNAKMKAFKTLGEAKTFVGKVPNRSQKNITGNFYVVDFKEQETVFLSTERVVNFLIGHPGATLRRYLDFGELLQNIRKKGIVLYTDGSFIESYGCYSGAFVAVDNKYYGLIPKREIYGEYHEGDWVEARVTKVRDDGKLDLSPRDKAYVQINDDAEKVMKVLDDFDGVLPFNDKVSPDVIKKEFSLSKNAFKRAVGHLLKEGKIRITDNAIERL